MPTRENERIENVPDAAPNADRRGDDDKLREETIADESADARVLRTKIRKND